MTKVRESSEKGVIRMLGETRIRELKKLKKKTFDKAMLQDMRLHLGKNGV